MEVDTQLSRNKKLVKKSKLSLNYIYKKSIIKENFINTKKELRLLNYEKVAKYKMEKMNFKILLRLIINLKNTLNKNNPLLKYIKDVRPYNYVKMKNNISLEETILKKYFQNKIIIKNSNKKEKILNFTSKTKNLRNFYYSRMCNIDYKKIIQNRNEKIILIQKHIRGFLSKKIVDEEVNKIIAKRIINKILIIQRGIRKFLKKKKTLDKIIINIIKKERNSKGKKIADIFSLFHYINLYKKNLIIKKILKARNDSILLIQNKFRTYIYVKNVKEILTKEKKSYILTYPFNAKSVSIKIYKNDSYKQYNYTICPIRKYFVLYIDKNSITSGEYLCHIIVNNKLILDKRYKYTIGKNSILYNLIYIGKKPLDKKSNQPIKVNLKENKKEKIKQKIYNKIDNNDDFFIYCYNDISNSTNSYSTKSDHEKKKLIPFSEKNKKKEEYLFNKTINTKINDFWNSTRKKKKEILHKINPSYCNFINSSAGNIHKTKICKKHSDYDVIFKNNIFKDNMINENYPMETKSSFKTQTSKKEESRQSRQKKYNNILNELKHNLSFTKSNLSLKNINSYSKKTHRAKFSSNNSVKLSSKKMLFKILDNSSNITINTTINSIKNYKTKTKK